MKVSVNERKSLHMSRRKKFGHIGKINKNEKSLNFKQIFYKKLKNN
jgi:hypothetical protein